MTQPLQDFLGGGDALARLRDHAARLRRLQGMLEGMLPAALGRACGVANLKGDVLVVIARSGATAARLKQMTPSLAAQFAANGVAVSHIQVRVGVENVAPPRAPQPPRTVGASALGHLVALRDGLPEDAPLRASLSRLIERSRTEPGDGG